MIQARWFLSMTVCLIVVLSLAPWAPPAQAADSPNTIHVPSDYQTIQEAIDAATDGDTVLVADGTYRGDRNTNLDTQGKAIEVRSQNGPDNCIIDCGEGQRGFNFYTGEGADTVVSGFTIRGGFNVGTDDAWGNHGSCLYFNAHLHPSGTVGPTIEDCVFTSAPPSMLEAVYLWHADPIFVNCSFTQNDCRGMKSCMGSDPILYNCDFAFNRGTGYYSKESGPLISHCDFSFNTEAGLRASRWSINTPPVINSTFTYNGVSGITCTESSGFVAVNCLVRGNSFNERYGGGMSSFMGSSPTLTNCTIVDNTNHLGGGGLYWGDWSGPVVTNCIIWGNVPDQASASEWATEEPDAQITYSCVQGGYEGQGNIDSNPQFVGGGDYHLATGSPCIDAGTNNTPNLSNFDFEGDSRILDGDDNGIATADMGVDEYMYVPGDNPPTDINLSNSSVVENEPTGTSVGLFSTVDPDPGDTHTYSLVSGTGDTDNTSFSIDGGTLNTATSFDFEAKSSCSIRVQTDDGNGGTYEKQFTITITNVNEGPIANDQTVTLDEDTSVDITLTGSDVDGDDLAFAIVEPPSHGALSGTLPNITYTPDPDYNGPDSFTFTVDDGALDSDVATVTITVNPVDEPVDDDEDADEDADEDQDDDTDGDVTDTDDKDTITQEDEAATQDEGDEDQEEEEGEDQEAGPGEADSDGGLPLWAWVLIGLGVALVPVGVAFGLRWIRAGA